MSHVRLFNHYIHVPYLVLGVLDVLCLALSFYGSSFLIDIFGDLPPLAPLFSGSAYVIVLMLAMIAMGVYQIHVGEGMLGMALRTVVSFCLLGSISLYILYTIFPIFYISQLHLIIVVALSLVVTGLVRLIFFTIARVDSLTRRVLILGAGEQAALIENKLDGFLANDPDLTVVGFIHTGLCDDIAVDEDKVIQLKSSLLDLVAELDVDEIVVAVDERRRLEGQEDTFHLNELLDCKLSGIDVIEAVTFYERELGLLELSLLTPSWLVFSDGFRHSATRDLVKTAFDFTASSILLAVAFPFMLLTCIAIKLEDGLRAPVLYRQIRTGINGKDFGVLKFRSMSVDAEKGGKAVWAQKNDSRVTKVGAFIRNTRIDELPQIFNVFKGEMSFVGPRPERPQFVEELAAEIPYFHERHRVKPGITGWAQLCYPYGASIEDGAQKLRYDLYYVKNYSLFLDMLILVRTIEIVLVGKGVR